MDGSPFYDLCESCFNKRAEIGHIHDNFLKVPASSCSLPTFDEHLDRLRLAMEREIPIANSHKQIGTIVLKRPDV